MSPWVDAGYWMSLLVADLLLLCSLLLIWSALERSPVVCFGYIGVADLFRAGKGSHDFEECTLCRWLDLPQPHSNLDRILGNWNLGDRLSA